MWRCEGRCAPTHRPRRRRRLVAPEPSGTRVKNQTCLFVSQIQHRDASDPPDVDPAPPRTISEYSDALRPTLGRRLLFFWFSLWALLVTIPTSILQLTSHQFRPTARNFKFWAGLWGGTILRGIGIRLRVDDGAKLDPNRPYIFVSNHQNSLDILALAAALPYPFGFIAKAELERVPFLGFAIRNSASVLIDRSDPRRSLASIREAGERIRGGNSVHVFAEGSRSYAATVAPFKKGAFLLAVEAGVPLVPVAIVDAYRLMDERRHLVRPGTLHLRIAPPISLEGATRRDIPRLMDEVRTCIEDLVARGLAEAYSPRDHLRMDRVD